MWPLPGHETGVREEPCRKKYRGGVGEGSFQKEGREQQENETERAWREVPFAWASKGGRHSTAQRGEEHQQEGAGMCGQGL